MKEKLEEKMKVINLIKKLEKLDDNSIVYVPRKDDENYGYPVERLNVIKLKGVKEEVWLE